MTAIPKISWRLRMRSRSTEEEKWRYADPTVGFQFLAFQLSLRRGKGAGAEFAHLPSGTAERRLRTKCGEMTPPPGGIATFSAVWRQPIPDGFGYRISALYTGTIQDCGVLSRHVPAASGPYHRTTERSVPALPSTTSESQRRQPEGAAAGCCVLRHSCSWFENRTAPQ